MKQVVYALRAMWKHVVLCMTTFALTLMVVLAGQSEAATKEYRQYVVKRGDTLSELSLRFREPVADIQSRNSIVDRDKINEGDVLAVWTDRKKGTFPIGTFSKKVVKIKRASPKGKSNPRARSPRVLEINGWKEYKSYAWKNAGADPYRDIRTDEAWRKLGYPDEVARNFASKMERKVADGVVFIDKLPGGTCHVWSIVEQEGGITEFDLTGMTWGSGKRKKLAWEISCEFKEDFLEAFLYKAKDDTGKLHWGIVPRICTNPGRLTPKVPHAPPPSVTGPPPPEKIAPPPAPAPPITKQERAWLEWRADLFAGVGQSYPDRGGHGSFGFAEGALYPGLWETPDGLHLLGVGAKGSLSEGEAFNGFDHDSNMAAVGPAYKYFNWKGWDFSLKAPMIGYLDEHGRSGDRRYRSHRRFSLLGFSTGLNLYKRELRGLKWFPELQLFASMFWEFDKDAHHFFDGKKIQNTRDLRRFDGLYSVGVRQIIYDGKYLRPYACMEFFGELPVVANLVPCIGVSDPNKIFFLQAGRVISLAQGGDGWIWSFGVDIMQGVRYLRGQYRTVQVYKELKQYNPDTGSFGMRP